MERVTNSFEPRDRHPREACPSRCSDAYCHVKLDQKSDGFTNQQQSHCIALHASDKAAESLFRCLVTENSIRHTKSYVVAGKESVFSIGNACLIIKKPSFAASRPSRAAREQETKHIAYLAGNGFDIESDKHRVSTEGDLRTKSAFNPLHQAMDAATSAKKLRQ